MNETIAPLIQIFFFPGGLFLILNGLVYEWGHRKLVARFQNRIGPRWFQPIADTLKLLAKEQIIPTGVNIFLFIGLPIIGVAGALTAGLYVPLMGLPAGYSFPGDLIVSLYLLSLLTLCTGLAGWNTKSRFSLVGATRTLTQLFAYEAPFLMALLGPALTSGSWQISEIISRTNGQWLVFSQPIGFIVAIIGLMGKLEMPPFDAPEAETEIVAGALTDYSGRSLGLFHIGKAVEMVVGLTIVTALFMGGIDNPLEYFLKTVPVLLVMSAVQAVITRLRIDQTVGMWWRYGTLLVLLQWVVFIVWEGIAR
jgi:NADH-quinone oxidoreductase subunit H